MKQWYANELSKLTQVSVRTLHHYDNIGLLKPSLRLSNRYRLYSEKDLLKLQQIIALKYFGFKLSQIKLLLTNNASILEHFAMQSEFLQKKAETLAEASKILKHITADCSNEKSIPWENIIQLIGVYRMAQQLENSWIKEVLNPEELKQYIKFAENLETRSNEKEKALFEKNWFDLVNKIQENLSNDPLSEMGTHLGKQCMELINGLYGKENYNLRTKLWEKGFKEGKNQNDNGLTPEIVAWLDKAIDAYWRQRIYGILEKVGKSPSSELLKLWNEVMEDMYGDHQISKNAVIDAAMEDDHITLEAKQWLKSVFGA